MTPDEEMLAMQAEMEQVVVFEAWLYSDGARSTYNLFSPEYLLAWATWKAAVAAERNRCAAQCDREAANPSSLWEEAGCWAHAAENCAAAVRSGRHD